MTFINHARSAALGKPAEQITPTPQPDTKQPSEGTPQAAVHFGAKQYEESTSFASRLLPGFASVSRTLAAEETHDRARRESSVSEALGLTDAEKLAVHREVLAEAVKAGDMSEAEAHALWARQHADIDPATLRPHGK
jgi:hypothetical protein